jgi:hypothetical protein
MPVGATFSAKFSDSKVIRALVKPSELKCRQALITLLRSFTPITKPANSQWAQTKV